MLGVSISYFLALFRVNSIGVNSYQIPLLPRLLSVPRLQSKGNHVSLIKEFRVMMIYQIDHWKKNVHAFLFTLSHELLIQISILFEALQSRPQVCYLTECT